MQVKIAHCADAHLVSKDYGDEKLYINLLNSFRHMIEICVSESVDILLIAGDLFDSSSIDATTLTTVQGYLKMFNGHIFISAGNHDYLSLDSPYLENSWPENVTIFNSEIKSKEIESLGTVVYGVSFEGSYVRESLLKNFGEIDSTKLNICLAHGDLVSESGVSSYHPVTKNDIGELGMDYLALGHIHKRSEVEKVGTTSFAYPGNLLGRGFDELGKKGFYLGEITKFNAALEFIDLEGSAYYMETLDMTEVNSEEEAYNKILNFISEKYAYYSINSYRVTLIGQKATNQLFSWISVKNRLAEKINRIELIDEMEIEYNYNLLRDETSLKGIFVDKMLKKIEREENEEQKEIYKKALKYGLEAFKNEVRLIEY